MTGQPDSGPHSPPRGEDGSGENRRSGNLLSELKRRKVYTVGVAYLAAALGGLEGASIVFPVVGLGPGLFNGLVVLVLLGFPVSIGLAWTFDLTEGGIERTEAAGARSPRPDPDRWVRLKAAFVGAGFVGIVWLGVRLWQPLNGASGPAVLSGEPALAVLPFDDFSPGGDQTYFVDGLHDELLNQLGTISGIRLTSRTSLMHFRGSALTVPVIADSLDVDYVLEGSVRTTPDSVALKVQLIDGVTDEHLWSVTLPSERTVEGLLGLQRTLAIRVATALGGTLTGDRGLTDRGPPTSSIQAYNEYLRGVYHSHQFDHDDWRTAAAHFQRAVELDPDFGRAHARLAGVLAWLNNYGGGTQGEFFPRIRAHAEAAVRLIPDDPWAHAAMVSVHWPIDWDWSAARGGFERALELDPNFVTALWGLAEWHAVIAGNVDRGLEYLRRAEQLDPFSPQVWTLRMWIFVNARRFEEAVAAARRVLELNPRNHGVQVEMTSYLSLIGEMDEARRILDEVLEAIPPPYPPEFAIHLARAGYEERAREIVERAAALKNSGGDVPASGIAMAYAVLGDVEKGLDWLERSFEEEGGIYYLRAPEWDNLASEPRFHAIWDRVGLPGRHPAAE